MIHIHRAGEGDEALFDDVAPGVFDRPIEARLLREFLADPRHHMVVALELSRIVAFASAVNYLHPDKAPELWINEVGVSPSHQGRRIGKQLLMELLALGREIGCVEAWVLTSRSNVAAMRLYASVGGRAAEADSAMFAFQLQPGAT